MKQKMIWPFNRNKSRSQTENKVPPFTSVFFIENGIKWKYVPAKDITAYEVAIIAPAFLNPFARLNFMSYFEEHNLMRHFVRIEE